MKRRIVLGVAVVVAAAVLFAYLRPLTIAHGSAHVFLFRAGVHAHHVVVNGHRLRYYEGGNGPPLLLVHGIGSSSEDWALVVGRLTRQHRVYAPDLLGWGGSDRPRDGDYSIAAQTELVRAFLDALHLGRVDAGGISMGGWIALRLAATHPERVQRLVLMDSVGLAFHTTLNESSFSPRNMKEARYLLWLQSDRFANLPDFIVRDFLRCAMHGDELVIRQSMHSMLSGRDLLDGKLQRVTMPVLIVWGTTDRIAPPSLAARLHQQIPQSRVVMIEGCGHLAAIECRDRALPPIAEFLGSGQGQGRDGG